MYRIDKFLEYYNSLKDNQVEIGKGVWVYAKPLPFYYGIISKSFWKIRWQRIKDAYIVLKGKGDVVTWE